MDDQTNRANLVRRGFFGLSALGAAMGTGLGLLTPKAAHAQAAGKSRLQVVKVSSGPLMRSYGLATVQLVTASAQTDATIPGLPLDEARILRDRLIELNDAKGSGL